MQGRTAAAAVTGVPPGTAGRMGDVDLESGQGPRLSLQFAADGADAAR